MSCQPCSIASFDRHRFLREANLSLGHSQLRPYRYPADKGAAYHTAHKSALPKKGFDWNEKPTSRLYTLEFAEGNSIPIVNIPKSGPPVIALKLTEACIRAPIRSTTNTRATQTLPITTTMIFMRKLACDSVNGFFNRGFIRSSKRMQVIEFSPVDIVLGIK